MGVERALGLLDVALEKEFHELGSEIRQRVQEMRGLSAIRTREDGDTTHEFDAMAEGRIVSVLERTGLGIRVSSEESDDFIVGGQADFMAIIDPIDGSDMVARGYPLASIAISIVDLQSGSPVYSRLLEIFTEVDFVVRASTATRNGCRVQPSDVIALSEAFVVSYFPTRGRRQLAATRQVIEGSAALLLNYGGPLDVAKVGSGQCDAVVELSKGFPPRDLVPGLHFATTAGAVVSDERGKPVELSFEKEDRQKFVVAANQQLLEEIIQSYGV
jgi:fructose-1,6-bisphosphatase/inositol monophosphatase family enzyme